MRKICPKTLTLIYTGLSRRARRTGSNARRRSRVIDLFRAQKNENNEIGEKITHAQTHNFPLLEVSVGKKQMRISDTGMILDPGKSFLKK